MLLYFLFILAGLISSQSAEMFTCKPMLMMQLLHALILGHGCI